MKNKIIIAVVIIVLLAIVGEGYSYYSNMLAQEKMAADKATQEQLALQQKQQAEAEAAKLLKCEDGENFSIVTRDHKDAVGQDILVKAKGANADSCTYTVADGDFEVANSDPQYYKAQVKNALVTDVGTGPSGRLVRIYDLSGKTMITEKNYFGDLTIGSSSLSYFGLSKTKADKKNCKNYAQLMKDSGNANLVVKKIVDLGTFLVKETKETNCVANQ